MKGKTVEIHAWESDLRGLRLEKIVPPSRRW